MPNNNKVQLQSNNRNDYWRYYGLQFDPFVSGVAHSNPIYMVPRWEEYCDLLHYLCRTTNALLLLTGVAGSGKTAFMQQFIAQFDDATYRCQLNGTPMLDVAGVIQAMQQSFGLSLVEADTNAEEPLEALVMNIQQLSRSCLLIIDDAHKLNETVFQMLLNLVKQQSETQMRLHILLLGMPPLEEMLVQVLKKTNNERELMHVTHLEPLTLAETQQYIRHCLLLAGLPAAMPLSSANIARIHYLSEGIWERINVVARQLLIDNMYPSKLQVALDFFQDHKTQVIGTTILCVVLIFVAIILGRNKQIPHFSTVFSWPTFNHYSDHAPDNALEKKQTTVSPVVKEPVVSQQKTETSNKVSEISTSSSAVAKIPATHPSLQPMFDFSPYQIHTPKIQPAVIPKLHPKEVATHTHISKTKAIPNSQYYTIQLVGLSTEKSARAFISENGLSGRAKFVHTQRAGKDWYVLILGEYATMQQAQLAIQKLPKKLQAYHPWPRKIATLQPGAQPSVHHS
jgi:DamX protein